MFPIFLYQQVRRRSPLETWDGNFTDCCSKAPTPLPAATGILSKILIGRGSQNYTCDLSNPSATPVPIGALATLYDISCAASMSQQSADLFTSLAYSVRAGALPSLSSDPAFANRFFSPADADAADPPMLEAAVTPYVAGHHFFTDATTPRFDLDTPNAQYGAVNVAKVATSDAPASAHKGSVGWLYLKALDDEQGFKAVYRVETVGGAAPTTCREVGMDAFTVRYAAQYWFYK